MMDYTGMPMGGPTDPLTLRMADERRAEVLAQAQGKNRAVLEDQAAFLPVAESEAAKKLMGMVTEILESRLRRLMLDDPQCIAMMEILEGFCAQKNVAKTAVKKLMMGAI